MKPLWKAVLWGVVFGILGTAILMHATCAHAADEIHWTVISQTAVTFDWRGSETKIFYSTNGALVTSLAAGVDSTTGTTPSPLPFSSAGPFAEAQITGLTENTSYFYKIGVAGQRHSFHTPVPRGSADFTVCVMGDLGDTTSYAQIALTQKLTMETAPAFVLMIGDLTYANDHGQAHVDTHFNNVMKWSQDAAYMPAWGNHEWDKKWDGSLASGQHGDNLQNYKGRFDLPNPKTSTNAATSWAGNGGGEDWYWFDYGNTRFIAIPDPFSGAQSGSSNSATWTEWRPRADSLMAAVDTDPQIQFIVTFGHRPSYCTGNHPGDNTLKGYLDGMGAAHPKYVLDLSGHSHNYERTYPQAGVTHIVSGLGGGSYEGYSAGVAAFDAARFSYYGPTKLVFSSGAITGTQLAAAPGTSNSSCPTCPDIAGSYGLELDAFVIPAVGCSCPTPN